MEPRVGRRQPRAPTRFCRSLTWLGITRSPRRSRRWSADASGNRRWTRRCASISRWRRGVAPAKACRSVRRPPRTPGFWRRGAPQGRRARRARHDGFFDAWADVRFALRSLRHRPGLTSAATLTLALGIGATSAVFGVVKHVLLAPLPYAQPDRVVAVWSAWKGFDRTWLSYDEWEGWKARVGAFSDIGIYTDGAATVDGDTPERVRSASVQANVLPILGVGPERGRGFSADEDRPGGPRVAVLSHELWDKRFGADPSVVGRQIQISGNATTIVGVMPAGFRMPLDYAAGERTDVWFPLATDAANEGALPGPGVSERRVESRLLRRRAARRRRDGREREYAAARDRGRARAVRLHGEGRVSRLRRSDG